MNHLLLKKKSGGMVLVMVTMMIVVMMVMVMTILNANLNKTLTAEEEVHRMQAEFLYRGALYRNDITCPGGGGPCTPYTETIDGHTYTIQKTNTVGAGPSGEDAISVKVTY